MSTDDDNGTTLREREGQGGQEGEGEKGGRQGKGSSHHLFIHHFIHIGRAKREKNLWYSLVSLT